MDDKYSVIVTYKSGIKAKFDMSYTDIVNWLQAYRHNTKFIYFSGDTTYGISPSEVADFKVTGRFTEIFQQVTSTQSPIEIETETPVPMLLARPMDDYLDVNRYEIECKHCNDPYKIELEPLLTKSFCRKCNAIVFTDTKVGLKEDDEGLYWEMTNNRFVDRYDARATINELREYKRTKIDR